mmetsp:Transcript_48680/g.95176  ORF Transcript_48680/g.95176 Transcript_48680/m.95176 type:complete len:239 (-) Transcript_48680:183-899(-)
MCLLRRELGLMHPLSLGELLRLSDHLLLRGAEFLDRFFAELLALVEGEDGGLPFLFLALQLPLRIVERHFGLERSQHAAFHLDVETAFLDVQQVQLSVPRTSALKQMADAELHVPQFVVFAREGFGRVVIEESEGEKFGLFGNEKTHLLVPDGIEVIFNRLGAVGYFSDGDDAVGIARIVKPHIGTDQVGRFQHHQIDKVQRQAGIIDGLLELTVERRLGHQRGGSRNASEGGGHGSR